MCNMPPATELNGSFLLSIVKADTKSDSSYSVKFPVGFYFTFFYDKITGEFPLHLDKESVCGHLPQPSFLQRQLHLRPLHNRLGFIQQGTVLGKFLYQSLV
jgi:hypothetical protein